MDADRPAETSLRWAVDHLAISRLQAAYGDAVTRRAWTELPSMFLPTCPIALDLRDGTTRTVVGGEAIGELIAAAVRRFEFFEFALLNAVVDLAPGEGVATGRLYMWELRQDAESHEWSNAYGLYRDRYERHDGRWRFAERRYSSLARSDPDGDGMVVFPVPE